MQNTEFEMMDGIDMDKFASLIIPKDALKDDMKVKTFASLAGPHIFDMLKDNDFYQWVGTRVDKDKWMKEYKMLIPAKQEGAEGIIITAITELCMSIQERMKKLSTIKGKEGNSTRLDITETLFYLAMVGAYQILKEGKEDGTTDEYLKGMLASQLRHK